MSQSFLVLFFQKRTASFDPASNPVPCYQTAEAENGFFPSLRHAATQHAFNKKLSGERLSM
jgi:hypothetical protein